MYYRVYKTAHPEYCGDFVYDLYLIDDIGENRVSSKVQSYDCLIEADKACNRQNLRIRADLRHQSQ